SGNSPSPRDLPSPRSRRRRKNKFPCAWSCCAPCSEVIGVRHPVPSGYSWRALFITYAYEVVYPPMRIALATVPYPQSPQGIAAVLGTERRRWMLTCMGAVAASLLGWQRAGASEAAPAALPEAIEVTATRLPEPIDQVPADITIVSGRELRARGAIDL